MKITIPIQNSVEIIICDVFVKCAIGINTESPVRTTEGKIAIDRLKTKLNHLASEMAYRITEEFDGQMETDR